LDRLLRDGAAVARSDGSAHRLFPVAVGAAEGAAIRSWVVREAAALTIEIGLGYGISALFVCEGLLISGPLAWSLEDVSTAERDHHWAVVRTSTQRDARPFNHFADL
jgi:hypothetical protein